MKKIMSITQKNMKAWPKTTKPSVMKIFTPEHSHSKIFATSAINKPAITIEVKDYSKTPIQSILNKKPKWKNKEYRDAYLEASIEQGVAWQIRINRRLRGITQLELAKAIGTKQSAISRLEDPTYGAHSLETLIEIAKKFDCALSVKFVSFSQLSYESERLTEADLYAATFAEEMDEINEQQIELKKITHNSSFKHIC
jgi:transcriptional regulator with XRE-family HTH domain